MKTQQIQKKLYIKPTKTLVESIPVKEGEKLSTISWEGIAGLTGISNEEWS